MLNKILRHCLTLLSFFYKNNLYNLQNRHRIVSEKLKIKFDILSKISKILFE